LRHTQQHRARKGVCDGGTLLFLKKQKDRQRARITTYKSNNNTQTDKLDGAAADAAVVGGSSGRKR
jgi:hypothetical protein